MSNTRKKAVTILDLDYEEAVDLATAAIEEALRPSYRRTALEKHSSHKYQKSVRDDLEKRTVVFGDEDDAIYIIERLKAKKRSTHYNQADPAGGPFFADMRLGLSAREIKEGNAHDRNFDVKKIKFNPEATLGFAFINDQHELCSCSIWVSPQDPNLWTISVIRNFDHDDLRKREITLIHSPNFPAPVLDEKKARGKSTQSVSPGEIREKLSKAIGSKKVNTALQGLVNDDLQLDIPKSLKLITTDTLYQRQLSPVPVPKEPEEEEKEKTLPDKKVSGEKKENVVLQKLEVVLEELVTLCGDKKNSAEHKPFFDYVEQRKHLSSGAAAQLIDLAIEKIAAIKGGPPFHFDPLKADKQLGLPRVFQFNYLTAQQWRLRKNILLAEDTSKFSFSEWREEKLYIEKKGDQLHYAIKLKGQSDIVRGYIELKGSIVDDSTPEKLVVAAQPFVPDLLADLGKKGFELNKPIEVKNIAKQIARDEENAKFVGDLKQANIFYKGWADKKDGDYYTQGDLSGGIFTEDIFTTLNEFSEEIEEFCNNSKTTQVAFGYLNEKGERCGFSLRYSKNNPDQWILCISENMDDKDLENRKVTMICSPFFSDLMAPDAEFKPETLTTATEVNQLLAEKLGSKIISKETAEVCDQDFALKSGIEKLFPLYIGCFFENLLKKDREEGGVYQKHIQHIYKHAQNLTAEQIPETVAFIEKVYQKGMIGQIATQIISDDTSWETLRKAFDLYNAIDQLKADAKACPNKNIGNAMIEFIKILESTKTRGLLDWEVDSDDSQKIIDLVKLMTPIIKSPMSDHTKILEKLRSKEMVFVELPDSKTEGSSSNIVNTAIEFFIDSLMQEKNKITDDLIDFSKYPQHIDTLEESKERTHINYGDLHGNAIKLIHFLIRRNILILDEKQYNDLYNIYSKINAQPSPRTARDLVVQFKNILRNATLNKNIKLNSTELRLIGDILADRGGANSFDLILTTEFKETDYTSTRKRNAVILTNDNVAYFIVDGQLAKQSNGQYQRITGINRQGLERLQRGAENKESPANNSQAKKIVAQAREKGGYHSVGNDLLTLMVFEKITDAAPKNFLSILFSNHDCEFFTGFWSEQGSPYWPGGAIDDTTAGTLFNLGKFIDKGITDKNEIDRLVMEFFIPHMKAIDFEEEKGSLTLFMHAPNGLETIAALAKLYKIPYGDVDAKAIDSLTPAQLSEIDPEKLKTTINRINQRFREDMISGRLAKRLADEYNTMTPGEQKKLGDEEVQKKYPLHRLIWNRGKAAKENGTLVAPLTLKDGTKLLFCHGHDKAQDVNLYPNMMTLDNESGKETIRRGIYKSKVKDRKDERDFYYKSSGQSAPMPEITANKAEQLLVLRRLTHINKHAFTDQLIADLEELMTVIEETPFDDKDGLPTVTKLFDFIHENLIFGYKFNQLAYNEIIGFFKGKEEYRDLYRALTHFGNSFAREMTARSEIHTNLKQAIEEKENNRDRDLISQADALLRHAPSDSAITKHQEIYKGVLVLTLEQLNSSVEDPRYQMLLGPTFSKWSEEPETNKIHLTYNKEEKTLTYHVINPLGRVTKGIITQDTLSKSFPKSKLFAALHANPSDDIEAVVAPYMAQILTITANRGHTQTNLRQINPNFANEAEKFLNIVRYKEIYKKLSQLNDNKRPNGDYSSISEILYEVNKIQNKSEKVYTTCTEVLNIIYENLQDPSIHNIQSFRKIIQKLTNHGEPFEILKKQIEKYTNKFEGNFYLTNLETEQKQLKAELGRDHKNHVFFSDEKIYKSKISALLDIFDKEGPKKTIRSCSSYANLFNQLRKQLTNPGKFSYTDNYLNTLRELSKDYQLYPELRILTQEVAFQNGRYKLNELINNENGNEVLKKFAEELQPIIEKNRNFMAFRTMSLATLIMDKILDNASYYKNKKKVENEIGLLIKKLNDRIAISQALAATDIEPASTSSVSKPPPPPSPSSRASTTSIASTTPREDSEVPPVTEEEKKEDSTHDTVEDIKITVTPVIEQFKSLLKKFPELHSFALTAKEQKPVEKKLEKEKPEPPVEISILTELNKLTAKKTPLAEKTINLTCELLSSYDDKKKQYLDIVLFALKQNNEMPLKDPSPLITKKAEMSLTLLKLLAKYDQLSKNPPLYKRAISLLPRMKKNIEEATDETIAAVEKTFTQQCRKLNYCFDHVGKKLIAHQPNQDPSNVLSSARDGVYKQLEQEAADLLKKPNTKSKHFDVISDTLSHADQAVEPRSYTLAKPNPAINLLFEDARKLDDKQYGKRALGAVLILLGFVLLGVGIFGAVHTGGLSAILGYKLGMPLISTGLGLLGAVTLPVGLWARFSGASTKRPEVLHAPIELAEKAKEEKKNPGK